MELVPAVPPRPTWNPPLFLEHGAVAQNAQEWGLNCIRNTGLDMERNYNMKIAQQLDRAIYIANNERALYAVLSAVVMSQMPPGCTDGAQWPIREAIDFDPFEDPDQLAARSSIDGTGGLVVKTSKKGTKLPDFLFSAFPVVRGQPMTVKYLSEAKWFDDMGNAVSETIEYIQKLQAGWASAAAAGANQIAWNGVNVVGLAFSGMSARIVHRDAWGGFLEDDEDMNVLTNDFLRQLWRYIDRGSNHQSLYVLYVH